MIKNNKINVVGNSGSKLPETDYTGKSSASIDVTVDNLKREITAEVIMPNVVGVENGKAYPSYLGNENRRYILDLESTIESETERAMSAESTLQKNINILRMDMEFADQDLYTYVNDADAELYKKMQDADAELKDYSETSDVKILDIMQTSDDKLLQKIVAEETRASTAEKDLLDYVTNINKELANTDIRLQEGIDAVQTKVDDDIEPRLVAVETFFDEADENGIIDKLEELQKYIEEDVAGATSMLTAINNLEDRVDNIHIPENLSELNNDAGYITEVPAEYVTEQELADKHYATEENVESLIGDSFYTKEEVLQLFSRIEFIDGGKAPVNNI